MLKYGPLGMRADDAYRNVSEARIVKMLLLIGWAFEVDSESAKSAALETLRSWTQIGLGFRCGADGERMFDPIEVHNFMKRAGLDGRDGFWEERHVPTQRRRALEFASADESGLAGEEERFTLDFSRIFNLRSIPAGTPLRLRMPLPLEGDYLRNLQVIPFNDPAGELTVKTSPGRMELRTITSGEGTAFMGAKLHFTARWQEPHPGQVSEECAMKLYLNEREGLIVVSERIHVLAKKLAGADAPRLTALRAFWDYINMRLIAGSIHYDQVDLASPCDWVLDSGWFDCHLGSALFVALCRASGIPARLLGGHFLYQVAPTKHFWAEAWIDDQGWTPYDFFGWELSAGGRDLEWRDRFFGKLDYRLTCECLPGQFVGALGVPLPTAWSLLHIPAPGGIEVSLLDVSGAPVHSDTVRVSRHTPSITAS